MPASVGQISVDLRLRMAQFAQDAQAATKRLDRMGRNMRRVGGSMTRNISVPAALVGGHMLKMAGDFEQGMKKVEALSGATGRTLERLETQAMDLGRTTQFSASEAADAMGFLAQAGFEADQIYKSIPATLDLAAASQMELGRTADIVSNIMTGFGLGADETKRAADVLTNTFTSTNTNLEQLGEAMKFVAPVAHGLGFEFEEMAAAVGLMGNAGLQAGIAGRGLQQALADMASPTKKLAEFLGKYNIQVTDSQGNMRSLTEIITQMGEAGVQTSELFGAFSSASARSLQTLLAQGGPALAEMTEKVKTQGSAQAIAQKQMEGLNGQLKALKSAYEGLALAIADSGILDMVTQMITKFTDWTRELAATNPEMLKWGALIAAGAAAAGPLVLALGGLVAGFTALISPVGLAVAAIAGIATALHKFFQSDIGQKIVRDWSIWIGDLTDSFKGLVRDIKADVDLIVGAVQDMQQRASTWINDTIELFVGLKDDVLDVVDRMIDGIVNAVTNPLASLGKTIEGWTEGVSDAFYKMADFLTFNSVVPDMMDIMEEEFGRLPSIMVEPSWSATTEVSGAFTTMRDSINTLLNDILSGSKSFGESLTGIFKGIGQDLLRKGIGAVSDSIASMITGKGGGGFLGNIAGKVGLKGIASKAAGFLGIGSSAASGGLTQAAATKILTSNAAFSGGGTAAAGGFGGLSSLSAFAGPAAVLAMPFAMKALFGGGGFTDKFLNPARNSFNGFQGLGGLGLRAGQGGEFGFIGGANSGFAAEFASSQGFTSGAEDRFDIGNGARAIKGIANLPQLMELLDQAQARFEELKETGTQVFKDMGVSATKMGDTLRDGVVKQSELAQLGIKGIGTRVEHAKTGVVSLGEISVTQFGKLMDAVKSGSVRLAALSGEISFSRDEMMLLGRMGITTGQQIAQGMDNATRTASAGIRGLVSATTSGMGAISRAASSASSSISNLPNAARSAVNAVNRSFGNIRQPNVSRVANAGGFANEGRFTMPSDIGSSDQPVLMGVGGGETVTVTRGDPNAEIVASLNMLRAELAKRDKQIQLLLSKQHGSNRQVA